jgi:hypothetical protein
MDAMMTMTKCASTPRLTRNPHTYSKYASATVADRQQIRVIDAKDFHAHCFGCSTSLRQHRELGEALTGNGRQSDII